MVGICVLGESMTKTVILKNTGSERLHVSTFGVCVCVCVRACVRVCVCVFLTDYN